MDESNERSNVMVKSIIGCIVLVGAWVCPGDITNVSQCINTNLTAEMLAQFPTNPTLTVQNCVLTFVKGSVNGDLKVFAAPFSAEIRTSELGISDLDNIPIAIRTEFSSLMTSVTNCTSRVTSYAETANNGVVKATLTLRRQGVGYNRVEVAHLDIAQTNGTWRIINWDVDE